MHPSPRAGLVAVLLFSLFALISAIPVPASGRSLSRPPGSSRSDLLPAHVNGPDAIGAKPLVYNYIEKRSPRPRNKHSAAKSAPLPSSKPAAKPAPTPAPSNGAVPVHKKKSLGEKMHELHMRVKAAFHKAGQKIKAGFQKFGHILKTGFKKVGKFFKTTGAKIAKFALKVVSTMEKVGAKIVKFIPVVGNVLSKGLEAESMVTNKASDAIHVSLGKKLDKGMNVMDKVQKYSDYVPRAVTMSE